jgi:hypothetical protein
MLVDNLRTYASSTKGQEKILDFIEKLKTDVGNKEGWMITCAKAEMDFEFCSLNETRLTKILNAFKEFVDELPPGHDPGHFYRNLLNSIILHDSLTRRVASKPDLTAGLLAGTFHDIGSSITVRYLDKVNCAGHAEIGAWLFYEQTANLLGESTRKLVAYSIAAHSHYLRPLETKFPKKYTKKPYWDELWTDNNDKLCGVAIRMARMTDRIDTNGPSTLLFRHLMSQFDCDQDGGADISDGKWITINEESLNRLFAPIITNPILNPPTALEHITRFANSNFGKSPYSTDDHLFPKLNELLSLKLASMHGVEFLATSTGYNVMAMGINLDYIKNIFKHISLANNEKFEKVWKNLIVYWNKLTSEDQIRWIEIFYYLQENYSYLLNAYQYMTFNSEFKDNAFRVLSLLREK